MNSAKIKKMTATAVFCALAFVLTYIKIPVLFLSLEVKDAAIVLATLLFGPIEGLLIAIVVPFLEMITHSGTGIYGFVMNVLSSVTFSMVAGMIYRYRKSFYGAIVGLVSGVMAVTAVMLLANLLITPYYMTFKGSPTSMGDVAKMIPTILLPFNFVKATLNGAIVLLLYKPLSTVLNGTGFLPRSVSNERKAENNYLRSILVSVIAAVIIAISFVIVFFVLK
ncbi:MAG: ECF transporter S component [Clostridia bacterium]|nr:ECF transporter S component [Clostridia bacterium]